MRLGPYSSYHEIGASPKRKREGATGDSSSATTTSEIEDHAHAGEEASCLCTFSTADLSKNAQCVFVRVDPAFWLPPPVATNVIADELRAYYEIYLNENCRFKLLMNNSVAAIGSNFDEVRSASASDVEKILHRWLLKPIMARSGAPSVIMGAGHTTYPWRGSNWLQPPAGVSGNSLNSGGPTFFAGWSTASNFPVVAFVSDWYDVLTTPAAFQNALLASGKTAAECLLADPRLGSYAMAMERGTAATSDLDASPQLVSVSSALTRSFCGLPRFCCFIVCTRQFVQFAAVHKQSVHSSHLVMVPLSKRLSWEVRRDRKRMAKLALGISCWLKRLSS